MKILHPTDFSSCAENARTLAVQLARALGAELILLHVAVESPPFREGWMRVGELEQLFVEQIEWAKRALEERAADCRSRGVPSSARVVSGAPHEGIVEAAKQESAAFIVMGTHGRGAVGRFLVGSVADRVVRTAPCAVVTTREGDVIAQPSVARPAPEGNLGSKSP
jgi:nucleotide-binding universal stress UspA family protein